MSERWEFIAKPPQTIEYNVLHSLERGCRQAIQIRNYLRKKGREYSSAQISGAMQRLRKRSLIKLQDGIWLICC